MSVLTILTLISMGFSLLMIVLSIAFKIAGKLRCSIPLIYFLLICTVLNGWASKHEFLALSILGVMMIIVVISWIYSIYQSIIERRYMEDYVCWQIKKAKEKGESLDRISFDESGNISNFPNNSNF